MAHQAYNARAKFWAHKYLAGKRGIPFLFTFEEWLAFWLESGHWHERGNRKGQYNMARFGDKGPYAPWNVSIVKHEENVKEAHAGKSRSDLTRQRISDAATRRPKIYGRRPSLGYRHTDDAKRRIGAASKLRRRQHGNS